MLHDKHGIMEIYNKHYGPNGLLKQKQEKRVAENGRIAKAVGSAIVEENRNSLMLRAKAKGIKNFRVLNKAELEFVLKENQPQADIDACVAKAVQRWHSGWGNKKKGK